MDRKVLHEEQLGGQGMRVSGKIASFIIGITVLFAGSLRGETIADCAKCYGAAYTLTNLGLLASDATTETWRIQYDIDTAGYEGEGSTPILTDYISSIAIKVSSKIVSVVGFNAIAPGTWSSPALNTGLNNNGCSGNGSGWICSQSTSKQAVTNGANYSWVFDVKMNANTLMLSDSSVKANFDPKNGILVSENVRLGAPVAVPEGFDLPFLLVGTVGMAFWLRRRSRTTIV